MPTLMLKTLMLLTPLLLLSLTPPSLAQGTGPISRDEEAVKASAKFHGCRDAKAT